MSKGEGSKDPYGAINFGEFRKYMQNKQNKLKRQQKELSDQASQEQPQIFTGLSIHINGYTSPPSSELRRMILQHGGDYQHYLKKLSVTHIIATNLTHSKVKEFRSYKIVKPEWIVESIAAKRLLPWQNYRLVIISTKQKELGFTSTSGQILNNAILANEWARETSTVNPDFIKRYYETSRLHYLSTWKEELKDIVNQMQDKFKKDPNRITSLHRAVMHVDFDCFFASVGIKDRPELKDKPVAVSHSKSANEESSSDVASCNYIARSFGVKNGMSIGSARSLCPELQVIPYEFEKYRAISRQFYEILFSYADELQAVSVDEALLEIGSHITTPNSEQEEALASKIRSEIEQATGCQVSVGIGPNILLARMSTKRAKPAGHFVCRDIDQLLLEQHVIDLPGVGHATKEKLESMGVKTISNLRNIPLSELQAKLGMKVGQTLYDFSRGIDNRSLTCCHQRQSVSAEVNWGVRFEDEENQRTFVEGLSKEVSDRLIKHGVKGKSITLKVLKRKEGATEARKHLGHGIVDSYSKSYTLNDFTDDYKIINKHAYSMLQSFEFPFDDIRGLGIHIMKLDNTNDTSANDQSKLNFKPLPEQVNSVQPITTASAKEEMEVDLNVYSELPDSVQQELKLNYHLKFTNPKKAKVDAVSHAPDTLLSELPPWSQIDPNFLLALPDNMREQVLQMYSNQNNTANHTAPSSLTDDRTTITKNKNTLTQIFQPSFSDITASAPARAETTVLTSSQNTLPYDVNVLNELPKEIYEELVAEHRRTKEKNKEQALEQPESFEYQKVILRDSEPALQGMTDINDVRNLIRTWVSSFQDEPEPEDVETVSSYLIDLIHGSDLEKVQLLMFYISYLTKDLIHWKKHLCDMEKAISEATIAIYGCPMQLN
ncbi:hypothetical protein EDC96DRAFT_518444 [Choanephora cucurbitarum]|nr:hypothetical protein EDC96DRAFT_518444 [Choanephora cucurbitarum]